MKSKMLIPTVTILKNIYFKKISGTFCEMFLVRWSKLLVVYRPFEGNALQLKKKYEPLKHETSRIYSTWESNDFGN